MSQKSPSRGPWRADQIKPGERYELSNGQRIYCEPAGRRHGVGNAIGTLPLATDPAVKTAGIDVGFTPDEATLRAPDIAIGDLPNEPGWAKGAPPLAVEYADRGTNEVDLKVKIHELLQAGARYVWIARLTGPRRVEVYTPGEPMTTASSGDVLIAEGVLKNPVPVDALFDQDEAHRVTFKNLLERQGYSSLEEVREEGREEGREQGISQAILRILETRGLVPSDAQKARILGCRDAAMLDTWLVRAVTASSVDALLD